MRDENDDIIRAEDVLVGDELDAYYRQRAAARLSRRGGPRRPFEEEDHEADLEREYQRIRRRGGV